MNIAILIPELGGGGAERAAVLLGDYYHEKGNEVYYFLADMDIKNRYKPKGHIVYTHINLDFDNKDSDFSIISKLLMAAMTIRKYKFKYKINVAISYMEAFNYVNILSYQGERNIVSVRTVLSERADEHYPLYKSKWVKRFYNMARNVVVVGEYARKDLIENCGVKNRKIYRIPNAFTYLEGDVLNEKWVYGSKVIISVGRLEKVKQQERLIRAFSYVTCRDKEAELIILGEGPQRTYLESLCKKLAIVDKVHLVGFKQNVGYYLKNSKIFAMTSKTEGFPNSMIEAMSFGLPVVSIDSPGGSSEIIGKKINEPNVREISLKKYGILTPYMTGGIREENLEEEEIMLGNALLCLLKDDKLYRCYSKRSLKRANMYSVEHVMKYWDALIM